MTLRKRLAVLAATLLAVVTSLVAVPSPAVADDPDCTKFLIVGVRGSGERYDGPYGMGPRAGGAVQQASALLRSYGYAESDISRSSLVYPATGVSFWSLAFGTWMDSVDEGAVALASLIRTTYNNCPNTRIGLVGYSQGAGVINDALHRVNNALGQQLNTVRGVLLMADPFRNANQSYAFDFTQNGTIVRGSYGGVFRRQAVPSQMFTRTTDVCLQGDGVCASPGGTLGTNAIVALMGMPIHSSYHTCCARNLLAEFGGQLGWRLGYNGPIPGSGGGGPIGGSPGQPGSGTPAPSGPPPVTDVRGLADGTVIHTSDTRRVYKMVGGAPVWQATCDGGLCPNPRPTTQAVVDAGPAYPVDGATAQDQEGQIFKFVGGAPIHLATCDGVGCGSPVRISTWSVAALEHMRPYPADGATAQDQEGQIFKFVGGAPIHLATCDSVGCGTPVRLSTWSVASLEHMNAQPIDGATMIDQQGQIFKFVGGAPIHQATCDGVGCGSPVPVSTWSVANLDHMQPYPADGATAIDQQGQIFKFVGGAPIHLATCDGVGCGTPVRISTWSVANLDHMKPQPADGSTAIDQQGQIFKFVGGAPVRLADCSGRVSCGNPVKLSTWSVANLDHMLPFPTNNATVTTENGTFYKFAGGAPLLISDCSVGCQQPQVINQWSVDNREHMRAKPADNTVLRASSFVGDALYSIGREEAGIAGFCGEIPCDNAITVNQTSIETLTEPIAAAGADWVDANGDDRADYCRRVGTKNMESSRVACTLSTATGFGATITSAVLDWGYASGRAWVDATGDGKADYCRVGGSTNHTNAIVSCTPSTGTGFGPDVVSGNLDWGFTSGRAWADANGDGKADFCRQIGTTADTRVSCTLSRGTDLAGATIMSGTVDRGYPTGRGWVDATGDGKADYCRVRGTANHSNAIVSCLPSTGTGFGADVNSPNLDWGFAVGRTWTDANGDGKADFCRRIGSTSDSHVSCTLSRGTDLGGATVISGVVDWGYEPGRGWADVNGDGRSDYCRVGGTENHTSAIGFCVPSTGTAFGADVKSPNLDWGYLDGRAWVDASGDGKADFCRRVGSATDNRVTCTLSRGTDLGGGTVVSGTLDWGRSH